MRFDADQSEEGTQEYAYHISIRTERRANSHAIMPNNCLQYSGVWGSTPLVYCLVYANLPLQVKHVG